MNYKAVLFDLDGTLLNTIDDLSNSMNAILKNAGLPTHETEQYKLFVGNGVRSLVSRSLPEQYRNAETIDAFTSSMRKEYSKRWNENTHPYEGVPELLDELKINNIKMAILSNKSDEFTKQIAKSLLPGWKFSVVFGERASVPRKPDPSAALEIAEMMGLEPKDFLYLGDSDTDMETANSAGMYAIGALWGFRNSNELIEAGAKAVIEHPMDLIKYL